MATKRVSKSAVDWIAFGKQLPKSQVDGFRAFKGKTDNVLSRVIRYPENMPNIDWSYYRTRIAAPGMVDAFEKGMKSLSIPYPKDKDNLKGKLAEKEKAENEDIKKYVSTLQSDIAVQKKALTAIDGLPPSTHFTVEMYWQYFPHFARDTDANPTLWPHNHSYQVWNDPHAIV